MDLKVTRCEDERLPDVGLFFKKQYKGRGAYGSLSLFHWKIRENYLHAGFVNLVWDGETIAATTSITGKRVLLHGSPRASAEIGDTYTDAAYQRRGLFSMLVNQSRTEAEQSGMRFIYGTPNTQSLPGYLKNARFDVVPQLAVFAWVFPVNVESLLRERIYAFPASLLAALGEFFLHSRFRLKRAIVRGKSLVELREEACVPGDWDVFWADASRDHDFILDRSMEALEWRFFRNPNDYRFVTLRKRGEIVGLLISRWVTDATFGTQLVIADFLTKKGEEGSLLPAVSALVEEAFAVGATTVSAWLSDHSGFAPVFRKLGFLKRSAVPVIAYMNDAYQELSTVKAPHFTMADSDNV